MGTIVLTSFISLDGVMQSPGGPTEDPSGDFKDGGWLIPFADVQFGEFVGGIFQRPSAFLLGRRTYDIFASHWPKVTDPNDPVAASLNALQKYVVTSRAGLDWGPVTAIGSNLPAEIAKLKAMHPGEIQVHGSAKLACSLLEAGLVDSMNLVLAPLLLGSGKRLFGLNGSSAWALASSRKSDSGMLLNCYQRAGAVGHANAPAPA